MNAGVWGVRSSLIGKQLMSRWQVRILTQRQCTAVVCPTCFLLSLGCLLQLLQLLQTLYQPALWSRVDSGHWSCAGEDSTCRFAQGTGWEQGAFSSFILRDETTSPYIHRLSPATIGAPCETINTADRHGAEVRVFTCALRVILMQPHATCGLLARTRRRRAIS
jgi:hypothetical protein